MSELTKQVGLRVRNYRNLAGMTQEGLAERADVHPTYIGQVERGEKNMTLESMHRIAGALNVSMSQLLENLDETGPSDTTPLVAFQKLTQFKTDAQQAQLLKILEEIEKFSHM